MRFTRIFEPNSTSDVVQHLEQSPFAWLFSSDGTAMEATPLPLLVDIGDNGEIVSLTGHMARSNPHFERLQTSPRALAVFLGPNSYISPSWCRDRKQAPTWNYVTTQFVVDIEFYEDPEFTREALRRLVEFMEHGQSQPWSISELAERYDRLLPAIIGFKANVVEANSKFKLGQNEKTAVFQDLVAALAVSGNSPLANWMKNYNSSAAEAE
jgi:transcriptional regulator